MKQMAEQRRTERNFEERDSVYLEVRRCQQQLFTGKPPSKLGPKYFGPFQITAKVGHSAYRLQLLDGVGIHPIFHVSLLKKSIGPHKVVSVELPNLEKESLGESEPMAIVDRRVIYQGSLPLIQVQVQWNNRLPDDTTWEYLSELLKQFPRVAGPL